MASRLVGIVAVAAALVFGGGTPVGARMWLEPAGAERAVAGPAVARGVVVWSHGRSVWSEDSEAPSPLYLTTFREAGFDRAELSALATNPPAHGFYRACGWQPTGRTIAVDLGVVAFDEVRFGRSLR